MSRYWAYPPFGAFGALWALWPLRSGRTSNRLCLESCSLFGLTSVQDLAPDDCGSTTWPLYDLASFRPDLFTTWPLYDLASLRPGLFTTWHLHDLTSSRPDLFTTWPLYDLASLRLDLFTTWPHRSWEDHLQYSRPSLDNVVTKLQWRNNLPDYQTTTTTKRLLQLTCRCKATGLR